MKTKFFLTGFAALAMAISAEAQTSFPTESLSPAIDRTAQVDKKHKNCLEQIEVDAETAYEDAMIWRGDGGGRRARHCEAMALFALGHKEQAAFRLDQLGGMVGVLSPMQRKAYYLEAANFWLLAEEANKAYDSASAGLLIDRKDTELRITRARVYALLNRYKDSETDLTSALVFDRENADALRYRAEARMELNKLDLAKLDIDRAMLAAPTSVETALLRGKINEAIRIKNLPATPAVQAEVLE